MSVDIAHLRALAMAASTRHATWARETLAEELTPAVVGALLDELKALRSFADRVVTVADEETGPHPVQPAEEALTFIERALFERRRAMEALQARVVELEAPVPPEEMDALLGRMNAVCTFCGQVGAAADEDERRERIRAHMLHCERHPVREIVAAWRQATGCDSPGDARAEREDAAGECLVPIPEPGTDAARMLTANVLMRRELALMRTHLDGERLVASAHRDRLKTWRDTTGCDDAEQAEAELARLRELERASVEYDDAYAAYDSPGHFGWDCLGCTKCTRYAAAREASRTAIAACRKHREGK